MRGVTRSPTPEGSQRFAGTCGLASVWVRAGRSQTARDPSGVIDSSVTLTPGALRDPGLMAGIPSG